MVVFGWVASVQPNPKSLQTMLQYNIESEKRSLHWVELIQTINVISPVFLRIRHRS